MFDLFDDAGNLLATCATELDARDQMI